MNNLNVFIKIDVNALIHIYNVYISYEYVYDI